MVKLIAMGVIAIVLAVSVHGCSRPPDPPAVPQPPRKSLPQPAEPSKITVNDVERPVKLSLSRTRTASGSPAFQLTLVTDGTVVCDIDYPAEKMTRRFVTQALPGQADTLDTAFAMSRFMEMDTLWDGRDQVDGPVYEVYYRGAAGWKLVRHDRGDAGAPAALSMLEWIIEKTLDVDRWLSLPPPTDEPETHPVAETQPAEAPPGTAETRPESAPESR